MKRNDYGNRMLRYLVPMIIIGSVLLSGCGGKSSSDSTSSLNQQPVSSSEPIVSYPTEPTSSDSEEIINSTSIGTSTSTSTRTPASTKTPSYDMNSWEWKNHSFEGNTISLPSSCYVETDKIKMKEAQLPESLFKTNGYPAAIGGLYTNSSIKNFLSFEKVNDTTYSITVYGDHDPKKSTAVLSDDPTLPSDTFYIFKDYLVFTYINGIGGDGKRAIFNKETFYIPKNGQGIGISFWAEEGSTEGKPFFERVVESVKQETK